MEYSFFDFCSGIGGGRLGLEKAGFKCIGRSETSRLADITYKLMHSSNDERNFGNLKKINLVELPYFDVLIAGFPCQSFSVIGRQEGFEDLRGQIIFYLAHIIKVNKPKAFILENVKGLVTHNRGNTLTVIVEILKNAGYNVDYRVLNSIDYGVPQMRQRVYFVGLRNDLSCNFLWPEPENKTNLLDYLIEHVPIDDERMSILEHYLENSINKGKYSVCDLQKMNGKIIDTRMSDLRIYDGRCPTLRAQRDGILYVEKNKICQLTGYEALLLQGFPKEYALRVKYKVLDRHLLMQAGNAMTVNVINAIGNSLIKILK